MNAAVDENREIGWGEDIVGEEQQFVLLPEGEYDFIVDSVNYIRKTVDNVTCGYSEVVCRIKTPEGDVIVKTNIKLVQKMMWKITEFFVCLGMGQVGQKFKTDWPATRGRTGRLKLSNRDYNQKKYNQIDKFLAPAQPKPTTTAVPQATWPQASQQASQASQQASQVGWVPQGQPTPQGQQAPQATWPQASQQQPWNSGKY